MMKKGLKYISIIILGTVLIITVLNFNKIKFMYNMLSSYSKFKEGSLQQFPMDEKNENIKVVQNPIEKVIGENVKETVKKVAQGIVVNSPQESDTAPNESNKSTQHKTPDNVDDKANNDNNKSKDDLYKKIVTKYYDTLTNLQQEYKTKIDSLVESGYEEYKSGKISTLKLASKYLTLGSKLETESDKKVSTLLKEMEKELKDNNLDTTIVKEVKEYYSYLKDLRKSELMSKARGYVD